MPSGWIVPTTMSAPKSTGEASTPSEIGSTPTIVSPAEQAALPAEDADDDARFAGFHEAKKRPFVKIGANQPAIQNGVDAKQCRRKAKGIGNTPRARSRPQDVKMTAFHPRRDLVGGGIERGVPAAARPGFGVLGKMALIGAACIAVEARR